MNSHSGGCVTGRQILFSILDLSRIDVSLRAIVSNLFGVGFILVSLVTWWIGGNAILAGTLTGGAILVSVGLLAAPTISRLMNGRASRRGQRVYDRWAEYECAYRVVDRLSRPLRRQAVQELHVGFGNTVVDIGCRPGGSFSLLSHAVGVDGDVIGVDYSAVMVDAAAERAATCRRRPSFRGVQLISRSAIPVLTASLRHSH